MLFGSRKKVNLQISYFLPQQQNQADPRVQAVPRFQAPRFQSRSILHSGLDSNLGSGLEDPLGFEDQLDFFVVAEK